MRERRCRRGVLAAVAVAALTAVGCAGIPDHGSVQVGRELSAVGGLGDVDVRVLPPAALPGMTPIALVRGFLRAMVNHDGNYEIARSYLTPRAARGWDSNAGVTTYDDSGVRVDQTGRRAGASTVRFRAPLVGRIDGRGDFTPKSGEIRSTFQLVRASGQWRIDKLPGGALLSRLDAQRSFRLADVFYLNRDGTALVPEQVLLRPEPRGATTALVRALLAGPGPWLAPAVETSFPTGTDLVGNVPVDQAGVAEVNLSAGVRQASSHQLRTLSAQLVWTLRQVTEIRAVRLLADGSPVVLAGVPVDQPRTAWSSYDPASPPRVAGVFYSAPAGWRGVNGGDPQAVGGGRLAAVAESNDGNRIAGIHSGRLFVGPAGRTLTSRLHADTFTRPTFDRAADVFTVATRGARRWVAEVTTDGALRTVPADRSLLAQPVQQLRMSRDGARVAAIIGAVGHGRLVVGRVVVDRGTTRLTGFRAVLPRTPDVRGLAWDGADVLMVTAVGARVGRELLAVDVNGYGFRSVSTAGLAAQPVDVAAAPGRPVLVEAGASVWRDDATVGWRRIGRGHQPSYAD
jgi:hypothetical protein